MKILYVCHLPPQGKQTAVQNHPSKLATRLVQRNQKIDILTVGNFKMTEKRYVLNGCTVIEMPFLPMRLLSFLPFQLNELIFDTHAWLWIKRHQLNYDLVHFKQQSGLLFLKKADKITFFMIFFHLINFKYHFFKMALKEKTNQQKAIQPNRSVLPPDSVENKSHTKPKTTDILRGGENETAQKYSALKLINSSF